MSSIAVFLYKKESDIEDVYTSREIVVEMDNLPRVGETIYFPHFGTYTIKEVCYHCSDDITEDKGINRLMFITIHAVERKS